MSKSDKIVNVWWPSKFGRPFVELRPRMAAADILAQWLRAPSLEEQKVRSHVRRLNVDPENPTIVLKSRGGYEDAMLRRQIKPKPGWFSDVTASGPLHGVVILLSGTPYGIQNQAWRRALQLAGARIGRSVSTRTDMFLTDGENRQKLIDVQKENAARDARGFALIRVMDERELLTLLHQHLP